MGKKITKGLIWGVPVVILLFGLFFCIGNDKADSLTKNDKDRLVTAKSLGQAFVEVAKKVQPAVVNITTEKTVTMKPWERFGDDFFKGSPFEDFFKGFGFSPREKEKEYRQKQRSGGSGVIVDKEGYVLTNNHVVPR
jgi:S1-C subfamily serine protease